MVALSALVLAACNEGLPDYRYKMAIHVNTPAGERVFSSVRAVRSRFVSSIMSSVGQTIRDELEGEAVILDLPDGRTAFALLARRDDSDLAVYSTGPALGPQIPERAYANFLNRAVSRRQQMVELRGAFELPRTVAHNPSHRTDYKPKQTWPLFVVFDDPARPASIREVSPESLGVRAITIEITDEPITTGIDQRLPWLADYRRERRNLAGNDSGVVSSNELRDVFGTGALMRRFRHGR